MIKGLAITPPVLGRISIGKVLEKDGKRLPQKDDQFTLTTQLQGKDGWVPHPLDETLRKEANNRKLRSIPVRMLFNDPDLNLRADYTLFDRQTGRPMCVGNGETCKRYGAQGVEQQSCPSPDACEFGRKAGCKPYGRLNVLIGDEDALGSFVFRTTGFNSIRTLAARLHYFKAVSGNRLSCMPLELKLRAKSTAMSHRSALYYVDLTVREGLTLETAVTDAKSLAEVRQEAGIDQAALEEAAKLGFANGTFEDGEEEIPAVLEEFYPEGEGKPVGQDGQP